MIFTCTVELSSSQMRGGANRTCGPISRMSCRAVSGSSGKLMVNPIVRAVATDIICSPIQARDRKSTRLNSSHGYISYAVFCLKKKKKQIRELSDDKIICEYT